MKSEGVLQHCRRNFFDSQKCRVTGDCARSFHLLMTPITHVRWSVIKEPWLEEPYLEIIYNCTSRTTASSASIGPTPSSSIKFGSWSMIADIPWRIHTTKTC
jgi:hypothetical protein